MNDFKHSQKEIDKLKVLHKSLKNKTATYRVNAIILLRTVKTVDKIVYDLLLSKQTVKRNLKTFQKGDIDLSIIALIKLGK
jgi:hypothetical protein